MHYSWERTSKIPKIMTRQWEIPVHGSWYDNPQYIGQYNSKKKLRQQVQMFSAHHNHKPPLPDMDALYCYPCHYQLPQYGFVRKLTEVGYPKIQWGIVVFPTRFTHCLARPSVVSGREPSSLVGNQRKCSKMSTWLGKWWSNDKPQDGMLNPIFRATHFHWLSRLHFFLKFGSNSPRGEVEVGPCPLGPGRLHLFGNSLVDHQGIWRIPLDPGFWAPHFHRMLTISGCQAPQKMVHTKYGQCI